MDVDSLSCPFKQIATSDETLLDALKLIPAFSDGCPFPKGSDGDAMLLKVLEEMPEGTPQLKQLLSRNASHLQVRLGIDGGSWDSILVGSTSERNSRSSRALSDVDEATPRPLAKLLKEGTKAVHAAAEKTQFVREFIKGRCERVSYAMMIKDLYYVYAALEVCAEVCAADPTFGPMHYPHELGRTRALEADMAYLFGPQWRTDPRCVPSVAARAYTARLAEVAARSPELMVSSEVTVPVLLYSVCSVCYCCISRPPTATPLTQVAHSYTRYLGDLSGGRVLMRIARRMLELPPDSDDGVRFYIFENLSAEPKVFKNRYRQVRPATVIFETASPLCLTSPLRLLFDFPPIHVCRQTLDSLCVSDELASRIVAEANHAFHLNIGLFHELDALNVCADVSSSQDPSNHAEEALMEGSLHPSTRARAGVPSGRMADGHVEHVTPTGEPATADASVTAASTAGCPFAKYAAQSGSPSMKCQRFATAERAAAERAAAERQRASSRLCRYKDRLVSWLQPTSSELMPLLLLLLALIALLLALHISRPEGHRTANIAPALAPRQQPLWRSLMLRERYGEPAWRG